MSHPTPFSLDARLRDEIAAILVARRDTLERRRSSIAHELPDALEDGPDRPNVGADALVRAAQTDAAIAEIEATLERIASADFGRCTACATVIAAERLLAVPEAVRCARCAP